MSEMKHTPGPWKAEELGELAPKSERMIMAELGQTDNGIKMVRSIARTISNAGAEQALANARLIAAAPELLEALIDLLPPALCGESWNLPENDAVPITITFGKLKAARAAIAKATGAPQ